MSYGVNDMRDGINLSRMQVTRPLVLHTEVTNLPNLSGFLRFGRNLPVVRFSDDFHNLPTVTPAFVERTVPPHREARANAVIRENGNRARSNPTAIADDLEEASVDPCPEQGEMFEELPTVQGSEAPVGTGSQTPAESSQKPARSFRSMAPMPGSIRVELDYHDRTDGPRHKATPA
jgi:hypothetical protein